MNYEFMINEKHQKYIAELLVETIIQDKVILTTREILNFIYDILVSQNFSFRKFQRLLVDDAAYLKEFLRQITPTLIYDSADVTPLMNMLKKYDPLLNRSEKADELAISYYVSSDISNDIKNIFESISYEGIICDPAMLNKLNEDKILKSNAFNLIIRIQAINENVIGNEIYRKYLSDLFFYNAGKLKKIGNIYKDVYKRQVQNILRAVWLQVQVQQVR